jgi:hypothetical protein
MTAFEAQMKECQTMKRPWLLPQAGRLTRRERASRLAQAGLCGTGLRMLCACQRLSADEVAVWAAGSRYCDSLPNKGQPTVPCGCDSHRTAIRERQARQHLPEPADQENGRKAP